MTKERRRFKRVNVKLPVRIFVSGIGGFISAEVANISEGGALLKTSYNFQLNQRLLIELPIPGSDLIRCKVSDLENINEENGGKISNEDSVIRRVEKDFGIGVEFVNLSKKTRLFIRELVSKSETK